MRFDRGVAEITPHSTHMLMRKKFHNKDSETQISPSTRTPSSPRNGMLTIAKAQAIIPHPGFRGLLAKGAHPHGGPKRCSQSKPRPSQLQLQLGHRRRPTSRRRRSPARAATSCAGMASAQKGELGSDPRRAAFAWVRHPRRAALEALPLPILSARLPSLSTTGYRIAGGATTAAAQLAADSTCCAASTVDVVDCRSPATALALPLVA